MSYGFKIMVEGDYACFTDRNSKWSALVTTCLLRGFGRHVEKHLLEAGDSVCY